MYYFPDLVEPVLIWWSQNVLHHGLVNLKERSGDDDADPETGDGDNKNGVDDGDDGKYGDSNEPEPEKDIYLLIDDVEGKNTETIVSGQGARGTVHVEGALGHLTHSSYKAATLLEPTHVKELITKLKTIV